MTFGKGKLRLSLELNKKIDCFENNILLIELVEIGCNNLILPNESIINKQ